MQPSIADAPSSSLLDTGKFSRTEMSLDSLEMKQEKNMKSPQTHDGTSLDSIRYENFTQLTSVENAVPELARDHADL